MLTARTKKLIHQMEREYGNKNDGCCFGSFDPAAYRNSSAAYEPIRAGDLDTFVQRPPDACAPTIEVQQ